MVRLHGKMVKDLNRIQGFVDNVFNDIHIPAVAI